MKNKEKIKKYSIFIFIFIITFFTVFAIAKLGLRELKPAEKNAIEYIKEKYGFEAKVISSKETRSKYYGTHTGYWYVYMSYNNTKFCTLISEEIGRKDGCDNYQLNDITQDLEKLIISKINVKPYKIVVDATNAENGKECLLLDKLYTGKNLSEVIERRMAYIKVEYIGNDNLKNVRNETFNGITNLLFINYKDIDSYNKGSDFKLTAGTPSSEEYIESKAMYIDSAYIFFEGKCRWHMEPKLEKKDDVYYWYQGGESNNTVSLDKTTINNKEIQYDAVDSVTAKVKEVTHEYKVNNFLNREGENYVWVYIPIKRSDVKKYDHIYIWEFGLGGSGYVSSLGDYGNANKNDNITYLAGKITKPSNYNTNDDLKFCVVYTKNVK